MNTQIIRLLLEEIEILQKENKTLREEKVYELFNKKVEQTPILTPYVWDIKKNYGNHTGTDAAPLKPKSLDCLIMDYLERKARFSHARDFQNYALKETGILHDMPHISSAISQLKNKGLIVKEIEKTGSRVHWGLPDWKNKKGGIHPGTESKRTGWDFEMWDK